jgi:hypothetical protein
MHLSRRSFFLGAGALVAAPSIVRAASLMPVRMPKFVPEPWLVCDGRAVLKSQYPDLYGVLGNVWGGDGQTTFNLPDLRGFAPQPMLFIRNQVEHLISASDKPGFPAGCINMRVNR